MSWGNSEGTKGRCDAKCHSATGSRCRCMCGGRFHGSAHQPGGVKRAVEEHWDEVFSEAQERAVEQGMELRMAPRQLPLIRET